MDRASEINGNAQGAIDAPWLFSEELYRSRYPDLTNDRLAADGFASLYDHYLHRGDREGRSGSLFFDPATYCGQLSPAAAKAATTEGAFAHFRRSVTLSRAELRTSIYFDPKTYLVRYPAVAAAVASGDWVCGLHHYLANDTPTEFDPLPQFSERFYLTQHPDIAQAIIAGTLRTGYQHFLQHGAFELRAPSAQLDLAWYMNANPAARDDIESGQVRDAFAHYLAIGRPRGVAGRRPVQMLPSEIQGTALLDAYAEAMLPVLARKRLDFTCEDTPGLSVVLVTRDRFPAAMLTLGVLRETWPDAIELLLVDAGSRDETRFIERFVVGAKLLRFDSDPGWLRARNAALTCATANAVLLIEDGVEVMPGAVAAALRRLGSDPKVGAVGARVIRPDGKLREAGGIVWRDGATTLYWHDHLPFDPEATFVRDVDFCSNLFLMARTPLLHELGGFDDDFADGGEDVDLCLRIAEAGHRVVYDPAVTVRHRHPRRAPDKSVSELLLARHAQALRTRYLPSDGVQIFARSSGPLAGRVLFIDDTIPLRAAGSGFVRSNDLITVMASLGLAVTVFPLNPPAFGPAMIATDIPDSVEVMRDTSEESLVQFLGERAGYYQAVWIARTHNLDRLRTVFERGIASGGHPPLLILDTEAVAAMRERERARLEARPFDLEAALVAEFRNAFLCQHIVAVSEAEAATLRGIGLADVTVIGHFRDVAPTGREFADRTGMLFLGAIHEEGSPNHDALRWFIDDVLPLIERELGWQTRLTVAGFLAPGVELERYRDHPRVTLRGAVADVVPLYEEHRVFVAPTRFAAGVPYKLHEAASYGLPVVTTELLRAQLGWQHELELLASDVTDPAAFAQNVVRLYRDAAMWQRLRAAAATRVATENSRERYVQALRAILAL